MAERSWCAERSLETTNGAPKARSCRHGSQGTYPPAISVSGRYRLRLLERLIWQLALVVVVEQLADRLVFENRLHRAGDDRRHGHDLDLVQVAFGRQGQRVGQHHLRDGR